jgi:hypothetical protein
MSRILNSSAFAAAMIVLTVLSLGWAWEHNPALIGAQAAHSPAAPKMARVMVPGYEYDDEPVTQAIATRPVTH